MPDRSLSCHCHSIYASSLLNSSSNPFSKPLHLIPLAPSSSRPVNTLPENGYSGIDQTKQVIATEPASSSLLFVGKSDPYIFFSSVRASRCSIIMSPNQHVSDNQPEATKSRASRAGGRVTFVFSSNQTSD
ncbi:hypothetical protein KC343_g41 [Hortaea werneckii]|nr:hypothetical protein KC317_g40 [Hortaea werneckii]KAI7628664.1 hypothetical protein KC346_g43 [Hortaea werneckii]KAI7638451.1 hypothetical protein KC343_g41 [Hortaea werneckii]